MNLNQSELADVLSEQQTGAQIPSRKARRRGIPGAAVPKAGLILMLALAMVVLEGAFRKWVPLFGEGYWKYLMYFSKEIIFAALLLFPKQSQPTPALKVFEKWLMPGCALLGLGALVSSFHGFNPVGALLTTRAAIVLPVVALLAVPRLAGLPVRRVALWLALFTIVNFALGVEQNRLPADHILNRYSETGMNIVEVESGVRATGTFSYITGIGSLSSVGIWAGLILMGLAKTQWQRIGAWATLAAGFGCGLVTVSRGPVVVGVAIVAGWLFLSRESISVATRGLIAGIFCVIVASGTGITPVFSELGEGLMQRSEGASDTFNERAFGQLNETVSALKMAPLGNGFGTQQVGGVYAATGEAGFNGFESPLPRLVMETGALGLIGYLLVCAGAILALQRAKRQMPSAGGRAALLATQMLLLPMFYGNLIFDHTASAFVWMIFAVVMAGVGVKTKQKSETLPGEVTKADFTGQGKRKREDGGRRPQEAPHSVTRK